MGETLQEQAERLASKERQLKQIEADFQRQYDNMLSSTKEKCKTDLDEIAKRETAVKKKEDDAVQKLSYAQSILADGEAKLAEAHKKEKLVIETADQLEKKRLSYEADKRDYENRRTLWEAESVLHRSSITTSKKMFDEYKEKAEKLMSDERSRLTNLATELEKRVKSVVENNQTAEKRVLEATELKEVTDAHVKKENALLLQRKAEAEKREADFNLRIVEVEKREKSVTAKEQALKDREEKVKSESEHNQKWSANLELKEREVKILEAKTKKLIELNKMEEELGIKK